MKKIFILLMRVLLTVVRTNSDITFPQRKINLNEMGAVGSTNPRHNPTGKKATHINITPLKKKTLRINPSIQNVRMGFLVGVDMTLT